VFTIAKIKLPKAPQPTGIPSYTEALCVAQSIFLYQKMCEEPFDCLCRRLHGLTPIALLSHNKAISIAQDKPKQTLPCVTAPLVAWSKFS